MAVSNLKIETAQEVAFTIRERGGKAIAVACDVTDDSALQVLVDETIAAFGRITHLVL